ncbi:TrmH family RNA methyltransferase [Candidatus Pandoraea novymonadis]|uniref:23S rRNA (Guanosine-2'-O-)-methyltransferase RlmB n=1 Tax=Candidatus Pandoraea novymonadis TaxID=1808959 RepID=A0ABX5FEC7_9BURK|nr:RNA methyltransferase [Candidatus Pandoraea novymonadis]PSB92021.1 23S rRNA (guanosine-2'-O-)-methyltransferase RlmB [Candidatus Pandoraea novymonadis]
MKLISSKDNSFYKYLKHLATSSQQRSKTGQTLIEGIHLADAYLDIFGQPLFCIVSERAVNIPEVTTILSRVDPTLRICLSESLFESLSTLVNSLTLLCLIEIPLPKMPKQQKSDCVILDAVQDTGNVGSILRTAAAAGVRDIFCTPGTALVWSSKVLRAGMGAHFILNIVEHCSVKNLAPCLSLPLIATSLQAKTSIYQQDLTVPVAWIFGNEGKGVSDAWLYHVDNRLKIPQSVGIDSLNVAACAAICLFEALRQRKWT